MGNNFININIFYMRKRLSKKIYDCVKLDTKKYKQRKSPPYHARECPNKIKTGNDGKLWISLSSITGIFTWKPYSKDLIEKRETIINKKKKESKQRRKEYNERIKKMGSKKRKRSSRRTTKK